MNLASTQKSESAYNSCHSVLSDAVDLTMSLVRTLAAQFVVQHVGHVQVPAGLLLPNIAWMRFKLIQLELFRALSTTCSWPRCETVRCHPWCQWITALSCPYSCRSRRGCSLKSTWKAQHVDLCSICRRNTLRSLQIAQQDAHAPSERCLANWRFRVRTTATRATARVL